MIENNSEGSTEGGVEQTSQSLICRAKRRDSEAWERLVKLYLPLVYFWCKESGLEQADVQDVFQEVFHSIARNLDKYRPVATGSFRGWLRTMTRNKLSDHFRKANRHVQPVGGTDGWNFLEQIPCEEIGSESSGQSQPSPTEAQIQHSILRNALKSIRPIFGENTWKAFWMVVIDGREAKDVAEDLAMKPGTVRVAKSRVLKRLRQELGDSQ